MEKIKKFIIFNNKDNVGVVLADVFPGDNIVCGDLSIRAGEAIEYGHKVALADISAGNDIIKYGEVIGTAKSTIPKGHHAHVHNIRSLRAGAKSHDK